MYQKLNQGFEKYEANLYGKKYMLNGLHLLKEVVDKICCKKGAELIPTLKNDPFRETAVRKLNEILKNI